MACTGHDDSGDSADMLHSILKEHKVHDRIVIVVVVETFFDIRKQFLIWHNIIESIRAIHTLGKVTEDEIFRIVGEVSIE